MRTALLAVLLAGIAHAADLPQFEERFVRTFPVEGRELFNDTDFAGGTNEYDEGGWRTRDRGWGEFSVGIAPGFMFDPFGFGATIDLDVWVLPYVSFGPVMQFGVSDNVFFFGLTPAVKGSIVIPRFEQFVPFAWFGIGLAVVSRDAKTLPKEESRTEAGLLIAWGTGADYYIFPRFSVGSAIIFDFIPTEAAGERFVMVIEVIRARFHF